MVATQNETESNANRQGDARFDAESADRSRLARLVRRQATREIHRLLNLRDHHRLLEVGCRNGGTLGNCRAARRVGTESQEDLLNSANKPVGDDVEIIQAHPEALPFDDSTFDRIICNDVLCRVANPGLAVSELRRVLAHNGLAVITTSNEELVNRVRSTVHQFPLVRLIRRRPKKTAQTNTEEHEDLTSHSFDHDRFVELLTPHFRIRKLIGLPHTRVPLSFAAQLLPN